MNANLDKQVYRQTDPCPYYKQQHLEDVVANRGEDLRFPISSSSGFSSPFAFSLTC